MNTNFTNGKGMERINAENAEFAEVTMSLRRRAVLTLVQ